ncbi:MAG: hypothetical protein CMN32_15125 [Saprospirales bacterium]|nr:hypothetical protein [Saprospirales bacterium]
MLSSIQRFLPFVFLSFLLFTACEEPLEFDLNDEERLVIYSNFSNQQTLEVFVSKTRSVLNTEPTTFLEDATVMVFVDNELVEILQAMPASETGDKPPFYKTLKLKPEVGVVYTIKVSVPGFDPVTATNSIPPSVPIESVDYSNTGQTEVNESKNVKFDVAVSFIDPADEENYYHLVFLQKLTPYTVSPSGDTILSEVVINAPLTVFPSNLDMPVTGYYDHRSFLIKDRFFNGEKLRLNFWGMYDYDPGKYLPGDFVIELRTVSEAYYLYHITLSRQINTENPLSEGVVVYDNVENGEGIFAGYSSSFNSFKQSN